MSDPQLDAMAGASDAAATEMIAKLRADAAAAERAGRLDEATQKIGQAALLDMALAKLRESRSAKVEQQKFVRLVALVRKYRAASERLNKKRPTQMDVAEEFGWESEQPMRDYLRDLGIARWHDVHALVAAARG